MKKKNVYKIFGAAVIVGLLFIGSIASTGLAAIRQPTKQLQGQSFQNELRLPDQGPVTPSTPSKKYIVADYDDPAFPLGSDYPDESCAYDLFNTPIFGHGSDLATVLIAKIPMANRLLVRVRNLGIEQSPGGQIRIKVYAMGNILPIHSSVHAVRALPPWILADTYLLGPIAFSQPLHTVTCRIRSSVYEGLGRNLNFRVGFVQGII